MQQLLSILTGLNFDLVSQVLRYFTPGRLGCTDPSFGGARP